MNNVLWWWAVIPAAALLVALAWRRRPQHDIKGIDEPLTVLRSASEPVKPARMLVEIVENGYLIGRYLFSETILTEGFVQLGDLIRVGSRTFLYAVVPPRWMSEGSRCLPEKKQYTGRVGKTKRGGVKIPEGWWRGQ